MRHLYRDKSLVCPAEKKPQTNVKYHPFGQKKRKRGPSKKGVKMWSVPTNLGGDKVETSFPH